MAKQRVTIADVAREAGTSTASVSYYLNDKREKLSEKTQAKIARVIKELGYVPNAQAQTLTGKQTHVIAIIILDNQQVGGPRPQRHGTSHAPRGLPDGRLHEQL